MTAEIPVVLEKQIDQSLDPSLIVGETPGMAVAVKSQIKIRFGDVNAGEDLTIERHGNTSMDIQCKCPR